MKLFEVAIAFGACLVFGAASAATGDAPSTLMCATMEALDCGAGAACVRGRPSELGAPAFMRVDLEQKTVRGSERTTPILFMESSGEGAQMLLQGTEAGFGWTMAIDVKSGTMAATLVNREGAFVLFGSCTPL